MLNKKGLFLGEIVKKIFLSDSIRLQYIIKTLQQVTAYMVEPAVTQIVKEFGKNPFLILISCLLSLRTKDTISLPVSRQLFKLIKTPEELLNIPIKKLEKTIFSVGFYKQKSETLRNISQILIDRFNSHVPSTESELLSLKGVGRKTANLVLSEAFGIPAICVDTHVHRISNRLGVVVSKTPYETEVQLKNILPREQWASINPLLVKWGQNVCVPISPLCSSCAIKKWCPKVGVKKSR